MTEKINPGHSDAVVSLTPQAVTEVKRLIDEENEDNLCLRIGVAAGGCSGMSYSMAFDNRKTEFDREFDFDGLKVLIDLKALMYLQGTTLDYQGGLMGGGFQFRNPKARRSCGCGSSFSC